MAAFYRFRQALRNKQTQRFALDSGSAFKAKVSAHFSIKTTSLLIIKNAIPSPKILLKPVKRTSLWNRQAEWFPKAETVKRNILAKSSLHGSPRYSRLLKRSWSINVTPIVIPHTGNEEKVLSPAMATETNFNSFISHLMGSKAQTLKSHKGKCNQCPVKPYSNLAWGISHRHAFHH